MAQPHIFLHTAHPSAAGPDHSLSICMGSGGGGGGGEVYVGERVKNKGGGPVTCSGTRNGPCQLQAEVTGLDFCQGAKLLENIIQGNSPAKLRSQWREAPLWASSGVFPGHGSPGMLGTPGTPPIPSSSLLKSGLSSNICFASPLCPLVLPSGAHPFRTLLP